MRTRIQLGRNTALRTVFLATIPLFGASGQTAIDLQTQAHNVDFTGEPWTRPIKTGTTLPANCSTGDFFFNLSSVAGQNLYACITTNTWTQLGGSGTGLSDPGSNGLVRRTALNTTTAVAAPAGVIVGTTDTQTLTNKSIDASEINSGTLAASRMPAFSGDVTTSSGSTTATLAAVNANPGTYGDAAHSLQVAVDSKGRITGITQMANAISQIMAGVYASLPASCSPGGLFFATDRPAEQQIFTCSASNTWTPIISLGPSGVLVFTGGTLDVNTALIPLLTANNAFTGANTGIFDPAVNVVSFSATPSFDLSLGDQVISLSADVTSSTFIHPARGRLVSFKVCQDGTGGHLFTWPANVHGGIAIGGNANTCSTQSFKSYDGSTLWAQSTGVINIP